MIGKLKGQVDYCFDDYVIIDVNGVGYLVYCTAKHLQKLITGEFCTLYIETHVREEHIHLYGFLTFEEKECFIILQQVSGIGPCLALTILSYLTPIEIGNAIAVKDKEIFRAVSGVGHKMAERILVELKGKFAANLSSYNNVNYTNSNNVGIVGDAISALVNLGINRLDAQNSVTIILNSNPEISINELIKVALKERVRGR